jgi:hypothetical protein
MGRAFLVAMPITTSFRDLEVWQESKRRKVTLNHYDIALGSQGEVDVQLEVAKRLGYCSASEHARLQQRVERVGRMLNGLIASVQPQGAWIWCMVTLGLL